MDCSIFLIVFLFIVFVLFLISFWNCRRLRRLEDSNDKRKILQYGLYHFTDEEGKNGIIKTNKILASKYLVPFCNETNKSWFCSLEGNPAESIKEFLKKYGKAKKFRGKRYCFHLTGFTEKEIDEKMFFRKMDKSIAYDGECSKQMELYEKIDERTEEWKKV